MASPVAKCSGNAASAGKDCTKSSDEGRRLMSRYTPEFKAEVLEYGLHNSHAAMSKKFNVSKSTLGGWIMNAQRAKNETTSVVSGHVVRYPVSFRKKVIDFGELHGWNVSCVKFGVSRATV